MYPEKLGEKAVAYLYYIRQVSMGIQKRGPLPSRRILRSNLDALVKGAIV